MCYGLDLLRSEFFSLLCRPKRWGLRSVILSVSLLSIRRTVTRPYFWLFMLLAIFSPILGINEVYAQESTNTPTWQPLFPTGTPRPTINANCPDGQPIGWGTVTPSFNWLSNCSQCIQRATADWSDIDEQVTPWPEEYISHLGNCTLEELDQGCQIVTHGAGLACQCVGQLTPTPNGILPTPDMTATNTANHLYALVFDVSEDSRFYYYKPYNDGGGYIPVNWTPPDNCSARGDLQRGVFIITNFKANSNQDTAAWMKADFGGGFKSQWQTGAYNTSTYTMSHCREYYTNYRGWCDNSNVLDKVELTSWQQLTWGTTGQSINAGNLDTWKQNIGAYVDVQKIGYVCEGDNEPIPPQPSPTPTQNTGSDYCNEVESKPVYEADEIGLSLPTPAYGQGQCVVIGFNIGTAWLENLFPNLFQFNVPDSLGVPDFQVCLRPMTLGEINVFGLLIDVDYLLLAASLIMVVRWLFRS